MNDFEAGTIAFLCNQHRVSYARSPGEFWMWSVLADEFVQVGSIAEAKSLITLI